MDEEVDRGIERVKPGRRSVLEEDRYGVPRGRFVYGRRYLERSDAVPIDPLELPLTERTYETTRLKGLFGALRDAGPDHCGRRVVEKHAGLAPLGELDYLIQAPDDRAGALGVGLNVEPPAPLRVFSRRIDLARLQALADQLIADGIPSVYEPNAELAQVEEVLLLGTSMGGARPKVVVEDEGQLWLAKFNRTDDPWNHARTERAMLELARECGIQVAESRILDVGGRDVLLVKRFDREPAADGYRRARMLSALTRRDLALTVGDDDIAARRAMTKGRADASDSEHDESHLARDLCLTKIECQKRNHIDADSRRCAEVQRIE